MQLHKIDACQRNLFLCQGKDDYNRNKVNQLMYKTIDSCEKQQKNALCNIWWKFGSVAALIATNHSKTSRNFQQIGSE